MHYPESPKVTRGDQIYIKKNNFWNIENIFERKEQIPTNNTMAQATYDNDAKNSE